MEYKQEFYFNGKKTKVIVGLYGKLLQVKITIGADKLKKYQYNSSKSTFITHDMARYTIERFILKWLWEDQAQVIFEHIQSITNLKFD